uniref:HSF-type DNA-binding domain-containing protein n=1 Tax=Sander lucioperca TaxID=283035 RepID=A0A8C9XBL4_SANLU
GVSRRRGGGAGQRERPGLPHQAGDPVEDPDTDPLICWSPVLAASSDYLPKFFKHNNMASFHQTLNMCGTGGFPSNRQKVVHIEQGGLVKPEKDDTEFQHPFFIRGQEGLLEKHQTQKVASLRQKTPSATESRQQGTQH